MSPGRDNFRGRIRAFATRCGLFALCACAWACAGPLRTLANAQEGKEGCAQLAQWAQEKAAAAGQGESLRDGESTAQQDARDGAACFHREGDDAQARATLLTGLLDQARERELAREPDATAAPLSASKAGSFDDGLSRALAALSLSAHARGEARTAGQAETALLAIHGRALELDAGDRTAANNAGAAVTMIDQDCFFCAHADVYGAQAREHVEQLGRWAGVPYVRRDDGREQFLLATRLLAEGERSPQQLFADAMRRRGRPIEDATPGLLARRDPEPGEAQATSAPLFRLSLRGFAFGEIDSSAPGWRGLPVLLHASQGELVVLFPPLLLRRAARDRRFVAPPDGVDVVVRYDSDESGRHVYRAVILRDESGVAEGP